MSIPELPGGQVKERSPICDAILPSRQTSSGEPAGPDIRDLMRTPRVSSGRCQDGSLTITVGQ